jgi:hypothetical protein
METMTPATRIDELLHQVEAMADPATRAVAVDLVRAVMDLHGEALRRMVAMIAESDPEMMARFGADDAVSRALVLHGLHPDAFATRLAGALEKLQQYFDSRGAAIEVLEAEPELVHVRVTAKRPGSAAAVRQVVEDAIYEAVPEVGDLLVEGAGEEHEAGFVPLAALLNPQQA